MLAEKLKVLRKNNKHTQKFIADNIKLSTRQYQDLEYGKSKPTYDTLISIADFFNVSIDYLVGRTDNPKVNK